MRILHVLDHSLPEHSGYSFRTIALLRESSALGYETYHLTGPKQGVTDAREETVDGWHFYRTPTTPGLVSGLPVLGELELMGELAHRIEQLARRLRPHVLHVHSPVLNAIPALRVARRCDIPVVYEIRALWEDAAVDHGTTREGSPRYLLSRALETYAAKRADAIVTICEGLRNEFVGRGVAAERITLVPNGVDIEKFKMDSLPDTRLADSLGVTGKNVLGFAGSFYAYEGLHTLIDALPKVVASRPNVKLLLVGGGFQEEALRRQVEQLGVSDHVVFVGRVPHDQVSRYYDLVDVFVYPRISMRLTEIVTPLKPLEAMAQGRLVAASDVGGHREMMRDGVNAVLFRSGDSDSLAHCVLDLLAHPERWPSMREAGRRYVESERSWKKCASAYGSIYEQLCELPRKRA